MRDKKNNILFIDVECVVLSPDFKLLDESQVLLKVSRNNNMYSFDLKNVVPVGGLTCLFVKSTLDESNLWHKRLGHINFKTMNKLVKGNLVRGLPSKLFENDHTCVACQKGKQHKASCIMREFSIARIPQQNGVAGRKNKTLIEATRTMLADSKFLTTFWAEVVNTTCYVQNRVLVIKPHNKTPYELFLGRKLVLSFMRPFGCPVTILNTLDHLGNQTNGNAGTKANIDAGQARKKTVPGPQYVLPPLLTSDSQGPKSSEDKVADDVGKKKKDLRDQEEAIRKQFEQESKRLFGQGEAANTNNTNRLNIVSLPINVVSSSFTTVDPGRKRAQRNEFECMFGQEKDANGNKMFTLVSVARSIYFNLSGSNPINVVTLPNADLPTDPLMLDLEDTADL
nr:ribonuclease H-like domain-containing protein [Tanacetum cinerariifolium]